MANQNRTTLELTVEEKVAGLIRSRHQLTPPVNILELASQYASIEEDTPPVNCDALLVRYPKGHRRPLIILNKSTNTRETRKRFTLAHEVGHIVIPGHDGMSVCHIDEDTVQVTGNVGTTEGEAHRFASELLMPTTWVRQVFEEQRLIENTFHYIAKTAEVSYSATKIKLLKILPPGYVCVEYNNATSEITKIEESKRTGLRLFINTAARRSLKLLINQLEYNAIDSCTINRGETNLRWWRLECRENVPAIEEDRNSADILRSIVEHSFIHKDREFHNRLIYRLNGFAGLANDAASSKESDVLYGYLLKAFSISDVRDSNHLMKIVLHPDFETFMAVKSLELSQGVRVKGARKKKSSG